MSAPGISQPPAYRTRLGAVYLADSLALMRQMPAGSVNLVMTSPPFALQRKKEYGNETAEKYVEWLVPFAREIHRLLPDDGSFVLDLGGSWIKGQPTRSLYHYEVVLALTKGLGAAVPGFHLAQEFFWHNPAKLPTPAEWVNVRRMRVKDSVNTIWWLSKTPWPKADNKKILTAYSDSMRHLLKHGYKAKLRPSGHDISTKFNTDNGGAIPPNLIQMSNTESNSQYQRLCKEHGIQPHPARFPKALPALFVRFLTDEGDLVLDPFGGSMTTGAACEDLGRRWIGVDLVESYVAGSRHRFGDAIVAAEPAAD